jgi:hypothetical protein
MGEIDLQRGRETVCSVNSSFFHSLLNSIEEEMWFIGVHVAKREPAPKSSDLHKSYPYEMNTKARNARSRRENSTRHLTNSI